MSDLVEFLTARLAEDEAEIGPHYLDRDEGAGPNGIGWAEVGGINEVLMASRHRMLRECEAKRRIIHWAQSWPLRQPSAGQGIEAEDALLRSLAAVYSDHPDYRDEWRP